MIYEYKIKFKEGLHSRPAIGLTDLCKKYILLFISKHYGIILKLKQGNDIS